MSRKLVLDNTVLNALQSGEINLEAASGIDAEYYVPVTQRLEFVQSFERIDFSKQYNICEVLIQLDPEPLKMVTDPYGVTPYGVGPYGVGANLHYEDILKEMGGERKHAWDALGAETTIVNDMEFVTDDGGLITALESYSPEHLLRQAEYKTLVESES